MMVLKIVFLGVSHLATYIFLIFYNEPEFGAEINPGMALTPLPSSTGWGIAPNYLHQHICALGLWVGEIDPFSQFHQHFMSSQLVHRYSCAKKLQSQTREKLRKNTFIQKSKMLMKFTPCLPVRYKVWRSVREILRYGKCRIC